MTLEAGGRFSGKSQFPLVGSFISLSTELFLLGQDMFLCTHGITDGGKCRGRGAQSREEETSGRILRSSGESLSLQGSTAPGREEPHSPTPHFQGDGGEERALSTEAEPWITVTLEEGSPPITQRQLQQVKRGKASQFFGLMGKQMGAPGYQSEQTVPGLLGRRRPSTEGREDEDQGSE
ncbi:tachykinin-4 isoform X2 [Lemur catta]|uniref:tachykinin-4 isoform X2 n=1 Tax=Lemur catta TaxID=9447 RepID=UPI001E26A314|nr:tachykinin-4 isoform X2 [Lemur catta]